MSVDSAASLRAGVITVSLVGLLPFVLDAGAADWPRWRGPANDGVVSDAPELAALPVSPPVRWRVAVGPGLASPVVAEGKVFHLDNQDGRETVHALDAASGTALWSHDLDAVFKDNHSAPGPRCTPVYDEGVLYAQSCRGALACLKAADGTPLWQVHYTNDFAAHFFGEHGRAAGASRHGYSGAPLVDGSNLIATVGATNGASVVCFDKRSGEVVWTSQNDVAGYAPPVIAHLAGARQVIVFTAEGLVGLAREGGRLLWRVPINTSFGRHVTTPVIVGDKVVVSSFRAGLMGVRVRQDGGDMRADVAWNSRPCAMNFASPVAVGQFLYGLGPSRRLLCIDTRTGERRWSQSQFSGKSLYKNHATFLVFGKRILSLVDNGDLVLFDATGKAYRQLGQATVCGKTWCNPAYVDGRLFLRDLESLRCIQLVP